MSKIRIYELAKEVKVSSKVLLEIIHDMGIEAPSHMAGLDSSDVDRIKYAVAKLQPQLKKKAKKKSDGGADAAAQSADQPEVESVETAPAKPKEKKAKMVVKKVISDDLVLVEIDGETKLMRRKGKKKAKQKKKAVDKAHEVAAEPNEPAAEAVPSKLPEQAPAAAQNEPESAAKVDLAQPSDAKESGAAEVAATNKGEAEQSKGVKEGKAKEKSAPSRRAKDNRKNDAGQSGDKKAKKKKNDKNKRAEVLEEDDKKTSKKKKKNRKNRDDKRIEQQDTVKKTLSMQKKTRKKKQKKKKEQEEEMVEEIIESSAILLPERTTVGEFAQAIDKAPNEVILKLMNLGVMAAINQYVDYETMELIAEDFDIVVERKPEEVDTAVQDYDFEDREEDLVHRAPVVTVMGHVDHGKTSLLDAIRSTSVTTGEAGGITQHIGASEVNIHGQKIVFLDTPGHEAFTSLRARGAQVTDIAVLVVAADDGVMPQTIEAIDHARAADVPIIVAVNKIDKAGANPDRVKQELSEQGVIVEDWGGDTVCVHVSALKGENIDQLLEMILLVAEMRDLKANPNRNAVGIVVEANLDKGKGAVATVLVQNGRLAVGDPFVCGTTYGRVRAMYNSKGKRVKKVGPSTAVEVIGINDVPVAGDKFFAIDSDKEAKQIAENRALEIKREEMERAGGHVSLEDIFNQIQAGKMKELNLIVKADAHGSLEALKGSLLKLNNDEVKINIQHANIGAITESDIMLATASNTIVLGFNVRPSSTVIAMAKKENVEIKTYRIIYELLNDIEAAIKGMLDPEFEETQLGEVQVRATFKVPNVGTIAGGYVLSGKVLRNSKVRLLREGVIVHEGELSSLKRFKDDVKEVATGYECGIGIANFNDLKEGDIIEAYQIVEKVRN